MTTASDTTTLPEIFEDEDGVCYYAVGHVDFAAFREAVAAFELECGVDKDELSTLDPSFTPRHEWLRDMRPGDEGYHPDGDLMIRCPHSDEGAKPFSVAFHD